MIMREHCSSPHSAKQPTMNAGGRAEQKLGLQPERPPHFVLEDAAADHSAADGVIHQQKDHRARDGDDQAVEIQLRYTGVSEG